MTEAKTVEPVDVWKEFHPRLYQFIKRRIAVSEDANDILQEVFLKVIQKLPTLRDETRLEPWLYQITRRTLLDYQRKSHKTEYLDVLAERGDANDPVPGKTIHDLALSISNRLPGFSRLLNKSGYKLSKAEWEEFLSAMCPFLEKLPAKYAEAVILADWVGISQVDLAKILGISSSGAKSRVQRGRQKMKELFMECCHFEFDARGNIVDYYRKSSSCPSC